MSALTAAFVAALLAQAPALDGGTPDGGAVGDGGVAIDAGAPGEAGTPPAAGPHPAPLPQAGEGGRKERLRGRVVGKGGRLPVAGAVVTIDGVPVTETDGTGSFEADVAPGRHHVQIQQPGFEPGEHVIETGGAAGAPAETLVLRLQPRAGGEAYETVVRNRVPEAPAVALQKQEMTRIPGTLGDPFRAIETLPGVATIAWPLPIYAVRGANPGNTGFFLDGMRVPALFHFALGPAVIHPYFLEGLEFFPGGYPARYGRFVGGAVVASTRPPPSDLAHASADVRLYDAGLMASGPFHGGKGTVQIAGRYSYTAALLSVLNADVSVSYSDAQLRLDHPLGSGRLTLLAFGSNDDLSNKNPLNTNDRLRMRFARASLRWAVPIAGGQFLAAVGGGVDATRAPYQRNGINARGLSLFPRLSYRRPIAAWLEAEVGADGELQRFSTTLEAPDPALTDLARPRSASLLGAYAMATLWLGPRLVVVPAYRGDVYQQGGVERFDAGPRLVARVRAVRDVWLKGSFGRYSQMPSLPLQIAGIDAFGLGQHGLQTSWLGAVGVEAPLAGQLSLDTNAYVQRYVLTDLRDPDNGDFLVDDFLVRRDALSYGLEVMVRRPATKRLSGWLAYTLSRSLRAFEGGSIGPSDWDQRHILNLVAGYRFGRYTLGGRAHLNTGRPVKVEEVVPVQYRRLPTFYQIDLRLERRTTFDRFTLDFYVELVNATLNPQVTGYGRGLDDQVHENSFRIVIPSIGVRAEL